ncbi:MAG TPA: ArsR family transcriptional regulator [Micromonosporaceae bacterium]|nr:ArsR family transcriptional regulator [Micromonosporaceae bacterium]
MRALAHPARLEILDHLSLAKEGATATECAEVVGLSPSATSYHLRALAKVGMIQEAPSRGDGRERVWQASYRQYSVSGERVASADEVAAETAMVEAFLARQNDRVRRYMARVREEPEEWFDTVSISDQVLALTADELKALLAKIDELVDPVKRLKREDAPSTARSVSLQIRAVPVD